MSRLVLFSCLISLTVQAQAVTVAVVDAVGLSDGSTRRLQRATEAALKSVSGLHVNEGPAWKHGAPRRCGEECAQALVSSLTSTTVVLMEARQTDRLEKVQVDLQWWVDGRFVTRARGEGPTENFEASARGLLETLVPAWARKGYGALRVDVETGSVLKVDGRMTSFKRLDLLPVTSGIHQVDLISADGTAVLQRLEVAEGARVAVTTPPPLEAVEAPQAQTQTSPTRIASYGSWMVGSLVFGGGFLAGALSKGTAQGLVPCDVTTRDCAPLDRVLELNRQSHAWATTGNVMLGVGGALLLAGAGLFVLSILLN